MKYKTFMTFYTATTTFFGVGFVLIPGFILSIFGLAYDTSICYIGNLFGAALLSLALLAWLTRNATKSSERDAILLACFTGEAIGLVLALVGQFNGSVNTLGWLVVAVYLTFTAGLGYFRFVKG